MAQGTSKTKKRDHPNTVKVTDNVLCNIQEYVLLSLTQSSKQELCLCKGRLKMGLCRGANVPPLVKIKIGNFRVSKKFSV